MEFKITLAAARVNKGLTQREAAKLIGVNAATINNWEREPERLTMKYIVAIEHAYGIPKENLILN